METLYFERYSQCLWTRLKVTAQYVTASCEYTKTMETTERQTAENRWDNHHQRTQPSVTIVITAFYRHYLCVPVARGNETCCCWFLFSDRFVQRFPTWTFRIVRFMRSVHAHVSVTKSTTSQVKKIRVKTEQKNKDYIRQKKNDISFHNKVHGLPSVQRSGKEQDRIQFCKQGIP